MNKDGKCLMYIKNFSRNAHYCIAIIIAKLAKTPTKSIASGIEIGENQRCWPKFEGGKLPKHLLKLCFYVITLAV